MVPAGGQIWCIGVGGALVLEHLVLEGSPSSRLVGIDMLIASPPDTVVLHSPTAGVNSAPGLYNAHQAGSPFTRVGLHELLHGSIR